MDKKILINILIILGKIIAPVGKLFIKLTKMVKIVKVTMVAGSFAAYAYMFTWKFAVLILIFLFVHEYGHLWAMKQRGMKTKGMYFIPFLGAAAVTDSEFKSYQDEVYVALMGPVWGIALALICYAIYVITGQILFIGAAIWMFLCTLFNLLPVMPLDGGRVTRCIAMSMTSWGGVILFFISIILLALCTKIIGLGLILFFLFIGGIEVIAEVFVRFSKIQKLEEIREAFINGYIKETEKEIVEKYMYIPGEPCKLVKQKEKVIKKVKLTVWKAEYLLGKYQEIKNSVKEPMKKKAVLFSVMSLLLVAGISVSLMYQFKHIPGADMALDILKDKKDVKK